MFSSALHRMQPRQAALPLVKALGLLVKTFSKPLGRAMARNGSEFPRIRNILMDGAQLYNRLQVSLGSGNIKFKDVVPLKPEAAIMLGCEFVSESVVFGIGFAFVYYEYEQSQIKEAAKEAARAKTVHDLKAQIVALTERVDALAPVTAVDVQVEAPKP